MPAQTTFVTALIDDADGSVPITALTSAALTEWMEGQEARIRQWIERTGFKADVGTFTFLPDSEGGIGRVLAGLGDGSDPWAMASLTTALPFGNYRLDPQPEAGDPAFWACFAWEMGAYAYTRYKSADAQGVDGDAQADRSRSAV